VWLDEHHAAHLGDFDSAIPASGAGDRRPITTNSYAAPEEREGRSLDARTDLFSLGGVLYVAATGTPHPGNLSLLRTGRLDLPSSFGDLVASLLSKSPDDRPPDAESVLLRLDEVRHASNIDALIAAGESDSVELKASLHHRHGPLPPELQKKVELKVMQPQQAESEVQKQIKTGVTKTVAAFLNTDGGTLLIGVSDSGTVLGIEPDFKHFSKEKRNPDNWLLSLRNVMVEAFGSEVWNAIHVSLVRHGPGTVAVVHCPPCASETWHKDDTGERFYMRAANATQQLDGSRLVRYIREHWPA